MKIKRNIKDKVKQYIVEEAYGLFGGPFFIRRKVYAFNSEHAVKRCLKKMNRYSEINDWRPSTSRDWAKWRIVPLAKPFERFAKYFR